MRLSSIVRSVLAVAALAVTTQAAPVHAESGFTYRLTANSFHSSRTGRTANTFEASGRYALTNGLAFQLGVSKSQFSGGTANPLNIEGHVSFDVTPALTFGAMLGQETYPGYVNRTLALEGVWRSGMTTVEGRVFALNMTNIATLRFNGIEVAATRRLSDRFALLARAQVITSSFPALTRTTILNLGATYNISDAVALYAIVGTFNTTATSDQTVTVGVRFVPGGDGMFNWRPLSSQFLAAGY
jgi:predicted porin